MENFVKVPANANNRRNFKHLAGYVVDVSAVPEGCEHRPATPFEFLTQTKGFNQFGAFMGRPGVGELSDTKGKRVFDRVVPLRDGYDQGGAYWGSGARLRVLYTSDLKFVRYYRESFVYNVYGVYPDGPEIVTAASTYKECKGYLDDYRENEPGTRFFYLKERVIPSF